MNKLTIGVEFGDHVFKVERYRHTTDCCYEAWLDNYYGCILFRSKNVAFVKYKNISFHGQITSTKNWDIHIHGGKPFGENISKRGENVFWGCTTYTNPYYKPKFDLSKLIENINNMQSSKKHLDKNKANDILQKCIQSNLVCYNKILNKQEFDNQLLNIIEEDLADSENEQKFVENSQIILNHVFL